MAAEAVKALSIVVYQVPEGWMAASLEYWCLAQGATLDQAVTELGRVMRVHVEIAASKGRQPYTYLPAAPARIVAMSPMLRKRPEPDEVAAELEPAP